MRTDARIEAAARTAPSERQLAWQELEFYAFIHFTINTFTDREWGTGDEEPALFDPAELDADQWVEAVKSAGMRGLILTCKHHDGFCLWPSRYTTHTVASSPWKNGTGDVVREVADACRKGGIKFGVYVSPWDRHEPTYGDSPAYNAFFLNQLRELLTNYGDLFCVWFDGACGEGPNGKRQEYDWDAYYALIRELQPGAVISVCGPDVRWCGNEAGHTRASEWSVVPAPLQDNEKIQERSQREDDPAFARRIDTTDEDLGSRAAIAGYEDRLIWYPAEVNTSIRPGWFYHASEDDKVKSLEELLRVYYGSVGGNASFLLNVPPDPRGLVHENDAARLKELGDALAATFRDNLAANAAARATEADEGYAARFATDGRRETFWRPREGTERAAIEVELREARTFDHIVLMEHIRSGQRIERFTLECEDGGVWRELAQGTVVGYKRICRFPPATAKTIRLTVRESRRCPTISSIEVYCSPAAAASDGK